MNKYFCFVVICLVLSTYCLTLSEGLDCYNCMHLDGISEDELSLFPGIIEYLNLDKSCKTGKKPKSELSKTCAAELTNASCAKLTVGGKLADLKIAATVRTCVPYNEEESCGPITLEELSDSEYLPFPNATDYLSKLTELDMSACSCNGNNCNSSLMLKVSSSLWAVPFVFLVLKRMLFGF